MGDDATYLCNGRATIDRILGHREHERNSPELIFGCDRLGPELMGTTTKTEFLSQLKTLESHSSTPLACIPLTNSVSPSVRFVSVSQMAFTINTKVLIRLRRYQGTLRPDKIAKSDAESHEGH
ncbi:hypothetical protein F5Y16DRAFT_401210 [Xylariaceae sp. FL0255]|nr:hypothetical protein F5Y16DRAFT_401210 [Xylariaceae sp. FL0255]